MRAGSSLLMNTLDSEVSYRQKERVLTMSSNGQIASDSDILATRLFRFPIEIGHFEGAQDDEGRADSYVHPVGVCQRLQMVLTHWINLA